MLDIPALAAGEHKAFSVRLDLPAGMAAGSYRFELDPDSAVAEHDPLDNLALRRAVLPIWLSRILLPTLMKPLRGGPAERALVLTARIGWLHDGGWACRLAGTGLNS